MEASISIEMMDNSSIIEIIEALQKIGWKIYNTDHGMIYTEYCK